MATLKELVHSVAKAKTAHPISDAPDSLPKGWVFQVSLKHPKHVKHSCAMLMHERTFIREVWAKGGSLTQGEKYKQGRTLPPSTKEQVPYQLADSQEKVRARESPPNDNVPTQCLDLFGQLVTTSGGLASVSRLEPSMSKLHVRSWIALMGRAGIFGSLCYWHLFAVRE